VVNTSATLPAALPATRADGTRLELHLSTPAPGRDDRFWVVELRAGAAPFGALREGETLSLPAGARAEIVAPYAAGRRLWLSRLELPAPLERYLAAHGAPIRYGYVPRAWPLEAYQNVYALEPGSAEMPSAGRPFSGALVATLIARGITIAPITLHAGLSSPERGETPHAERFAVTEPTARLVNAVRGWGGRVIAVGTTVVRALETVATAEGVVAGRGWTNAVITPERGVSTVDGLLTGWHEPQASHLQMLEAIAGPELLERSYDTAIERGYRWHEFGDSHLILP
jgi:S-adenosylmethionine:tRNA ribosyltransferase-isomerase